MFLGAILQIIFSVYRIRARVTMILINILYPINILYKYFNKKNKSDDSCLR